VFDRQRAFEDTVYLAPGQLHASSEPCTMATVLGSCVSVCLYDAKLRQGGMNHFLLPGEREGAESSHRYGGAALSGLLEELQRLGSPARHLQAGVFGGARILAGVSELMHLGERNVEFAFEWLREQRIPIVARDVLGPRARRLEFRSNDGTTRIRLLGES